MADGGYGPLRLNLGAGDTAIPGFVPIDRKHGKEVYPLDVPDGSVDEIRASHVLEHFSHREASNVVNHWVEKLAPGGRLRVAVPDFDWITRAYRDGEPADIQGYTMGSQSDENDYHKSMWDIDVLDEVFLAAGLERLHSWESEITDCAALAVSLNRGGYKPLGPAKVCTDTTAVLSAPRFGPVMHFREAIKAFGRARVPYQVAGGAYWHQVISTLLDEHAQTAKYVITCDYDTVFQYEDLLDLYRLMEAKPEADAITTVQSKRNDTTALFGIRDAHGEHVRNIPAYQLTRHLLPITTGHFGLTIFRAASLRVHPHPWMLPTPNEAGKWEEGKVDADIQFWLKWRDMGRTLYLAPKIVVGHLEEVITWPDHQLNPVHQSVMDYDQHGKPSEINR